MRSAPLDRLPAPIARLARLRRTTIVGGVVLIAVIVVWALFPLPAVDPPEIALEQPRPARATPKEVEFNLAAFDAPIWVTPPPAEVPSKQEDPAPPPPARITLELVAIENNGDMLRVTLFDPQAKKLLTATAGETIAGHEVAEISQDEVMLTIGGRTGVLKLRDEPPIVKLESLRRRIGSRTP